MIVDDINSPSLCLHDGILVYLSSNVSDAQIIPEPTMQSYQSLLRHSIIFLESTFQKDNAVAFALPSVVGPSIYIIPPIHFHSMRSRGHDNAYLNK